MIETETHIFEPFKHHIPAGGYVTCLDGETFYWVNGVDQHRLSVIHLHVDYRAEVRMPDGSLVDVPTGWKPKNPDWSPADNQIRPERVQEIAAMVRGGQPVPIDALLPTVFASPNSQSIDYWNTTDWALAAQQGKLGCHPALVPQGTITIHTASNVYMPTTPGTPEHDIKWRTRFFKARAMPESAVKMGVITAEELDALGWTLDTERHTYRAPTPAESQLDVLRHMEATARAEMFRQRAIPVAAVENGIISCSEIDALGWTFDFTTEVFRPAAVEEAGNHDWNGPTEKHDVKDDEGNVMRTERRAVSEPVADRAHQVVGDILAGKVIPGQRDQIKDALQRSPPREETTASTSKRMPDKAIGLQRAAVGLFLP